MAEIAKVNSVEAIETFRSALLIYLSKARPVLDDACDQVHRIREWLRIEQRVHWENQVRRRSRELENAQQALFSAELAKLRPPTHAELIAVRKAKESLAEAEEKLRRVKRWSLDFDNHVAPLVKQLEELRTTLKNEMPKGAAFLANAVKTLDAYASVKIGPMPSSLPPASENTNNTETNRQTIPDAPGASAKIVDSQGKQP